MEAIFTMGATTLIGYLTFNYLESLQDQSTKDDYDNNVEVQNTIPTKIKARKEKEDSFNKYVELAIMYGDIIPLCCYIKANPLEIFRELPNGFNLFNLACINGRVDLVLFLLSLQIGNKVQKMKIEEIKEILLKNGCTYVEIQTFKKHYLKQTNTHKKNLKKTKIHSFVSKYLTKFYVRNN